MGLALALAPVASAQDYSQNPNYGSANLSGGFTPDPYRVSLRAGGSIDVSQSISRCRGYITNAPDFRLSFSAGSLPLIISVASSADTTLVINGPDGNFYCDDDGGVNGSNPSVRFNSPGSGQYDIWVGTYSPGSNPSATLHISEVSSQ
ncbi:peptidase S1 [Brevundimonas sp. AAP58]|nr:peptidase S1 [Brevundimonas sp. AAP58]